MSDPSPDGRDTAEQPGDRSQAGDADFVRRAAAGDLEAFEGLYREHVGRVHALCLRMARDRGEAEELTQETFVRVWEKLQSFRGESAFSTWLHRVTVNVVVAGLRRQGRWRERFTAQDAEDVGIAQPAFSPGGDLDLERAIAALPPKARLVFLLHDVEGHGHGEIASMLGLAVGTSKAHLHRARLQLREELSR